MRWLISFLAIGVVALGAGYDRRIAQRRRGERSRVTRPEISRWEEEGGTVPDDSGPPTAQTTTH